MVVSFSLPLVCHSPYRFSLVTCALADVAELLQSWRPGGTDGTAEVGGPVLAVPFRPCVPLSLLTFRSGSVELTHEPRCLKSLSSLRAVPPVNAGVTEANMIAHAGNK